MPEEEKIVHIGIENLGIDECNIRQGIWDRNQELIDSVKEIGVQEPLLVRPADPKTGKKYAIVCGSRRFNATVDAGRQTVPCIIRENLSDIDAMTLSLIENRQRAPTPTWMDIEYIGRIYHFYLNERMINRDIIDRLFNKTGIGTFTLEKYIRIYGLPVEVKGLLRDPEERTTRQREYLMRFPTRRIYRTLPIGHADLMTELEKFPLEKQVEVAIFISGISADLAKMLIDLVKIYPEKDLDELYNKMIKEEFRWYEKGLRFDKATWEALCDACMEKQTYYDDLCIRIIKKWLRDEGFLIPERKKFMPKQTTPLELRELLGKAHVKVETSVKKLTECGYRFLKEEGTSKIYQRHEREISAFYKAYCRGHDIWLTLTPGNYDFPELLLNAEKERLEGKGEM